MGYETRLIIGRASRVLCAEVKQSEIGQIEANYIYYPPLKDADGADIPTGRQEVYFQVYAIVDLCVCGRHSALHRLPRINNDPERVWYFFGADGNTPIKLDKYGTAMRPVPLADVITAIEDDFEAWAAEGYRRFDWALALLRVMVQDEEDITCLLFGY